MVDIQELKNRISCVQYAQRLGYNIHKSGDRCVSPFHNGTNKSSMVVHDNFWFSFSDNLGGDVIDLAARVKYGGNRAAAINELAELVGLQSNFNAKNYRDYMQNYGNGMFYYNTQLTTEITQYLHSRRISDTTINTLKIGYDPKSRRITIPLWKNGLIVSHIARATQPNQEPKYLKPKNNEYTDHSAVWGCNTIDRETDTIFVCEGAFDALSVYQSKYAVLATLGGYFSSKQINYVVGVCKNFKNIVLAFDNDKPGQEFTLKMARILLRHGIKFLIADIPTKFKDISEYYAAGNAIEDLSLYDGFKLICSTVSDKQQFKDFMFNLARFTERADMAEYFEIALKNSNFSTNWLSEIQKACYKPPAETAVIADVIRDHKIKYIDSVGFYEYDKPITGIWNKIPDSYVGGYISEILGHFATGTKLKSIITLMKNQLTEPLLFDKKPIWSFTNGVLELDTGTFRQHQEMDYCTFQSEYPYDPSARCPQWEKFINQITFDDGRSEELLQQIAGYVLYSDCSLQRIFCLIGAGGNGKSVYLNVLQRLFNPSVCSDLEPNDMLKDFHLIKLKDSILNIASDIDSNIKNTENLLKRISTGEKISACYKHQNYVDFNPRCKLVFSTNEMPTVNTVKGLDRRLLFVNFPCQFVDEPNPSDPTQFKRDIYIEQKLTAELQGIFNWAYEGYKMLKRDGVFTDTNAQEDLMTQFKQLSEPIEIFVAEFKEEHPESDVYIKAELYNIYTNWCIEAGHRSLSRNKFFMKFKEFLTHQKKLNG